MPQMTTDQKKNLSLMLSYPPSVNTYWGFHGHRRFLTKKAQEFKSSVSNAFLQTKSVGFDKADLSITVRLYPPDRRVRDIDNVLKPLLDALVSAGIFNDDSQVSLLIVSRETVIKGGACQLYIQEK